MWFIRRDVVTSRKPHELIITVVTDIADTGKYQRGIAQIAFNLNDEQQWTVASATEHAVWSLIGENYLKGHCEKTFSAIKNEHIEKFLAWTSKTLIGSGIARFEMVKYQIFPTRGQIPDFPHLSLITCMCFTTIFFQERERWFSDQNLIFFHDVLLDAGTLTHSNQQHEKL